MVRKRRKPFFTISRPHSLTHDGRRAQGAARRWARTREAVGAPRSTTGSGSKSALEVSVAQTLGANPHPDEQPKTSSPRTSSPRMSSPSGPSSGSCESNKPATPSAGGSELEPRGRRRGLAVNERSAGCARLALRVGGERVRRRRARSAAARTAHPSRRSVSTTARRRRRRRMRRRHRRRRRRDR